MSLMQEGLLCSEKVKVILKNKDKILFVSTAGVGDWFLSLPTMKILSKEYNVYNLCMDNVISFANDQSWLYKVWEYKISSVKGYSLITRVLNFIALVLKINVSGIDNIVLPVSIEGSIGIRNILRFCPFARKIGFDNPFIKDNLDEIIEVKLNEKDEAQNRKILNVLNIENVINEGVFEVKNEILDEIKEYLRSVTKGNGFIVFHPYANMIKGKRKKWLNEEQYVKLAGLLDTHLKDRYIIFVGHVRNLKDMERLAGINSEKFIVFPPEMGLKRVAGLIYFSDLVLCVDGGIMHIAATLMKKIVAIWGPTYLRRSYESEEWKVVRYPMECFPCWDTEMLHNCSHMNCLHMIEPHKIADEVIKLLNK